jgi:hypothetical protein
VESPKKWNAVREYMPEVECVVHHHYRGNDLNRSRQV